MKDPAVLFYFQDFLVGTEFMTDEEVGKYIRILCHQADKGALTLPQLKRICSGNVPEAIMEKLLQDEGGKYYQERMRSEREKRINYSDSRRKNRERKDNNICETYDTHMENENENENEIVNEDKKKRRRTPFKAPLIEEVIQYFDDNGYEKGAAEKAFKYYDVANWFDSKGNPILNWKQKMQAVWFKEENKKHGLKVAM
jgi:hypothetical protein